MGQAAARLLRPFQRASARDHVLPTHGPMCAPRIARDDAAFGGRLPVQRTRPSRVATLGRILIINKRVQLTSSSTRLSLFEVTRNVLPTSRGICEMAHTPRKNAGAAISRS